MIIKFFEKEKIEKIGLDFYLIYGDNEGQKKESLESILKNTKIGNFHGLAIDSRAVKKGNIFLT